MEIKIDIGETVIRRERGHMGDDIIGLIDLGILLVGVLLCLISPILGAIPVLWGIVSIKHIFFGLIRGLIAKKREIICTDRRLILKDAGGGLTYINLAEIESIEAEDDYFIFKFLNMSNAFHYGDLVITMKKNSSATFEKLEWPLVPHVKNHKEWRDVIIEQVNKLQ